MHRRIQEVGGDEIYREARNLVLLSLGNVAITTAGKLQAKKIFHGVVIDWHSELLPFHEVIPIGFFNVTVDTPSPPNSRGEQLEKKLAGKHFCIST